MWIRLYLTWGAYKKSDMLEHVLKSCSLCIKSFIFFSRTRRVRSCGWAWRRWGWTSTSRTTASRPKSPSPGARSRTSPSRTKRYRPNHLQIQVLEWKVLGLKNVFDNFSVNFMRFLNLYPKYKYEQASTVIKWLQFKLFLDIGNEI